MTEKELLDKIDEWHESDSKLPLHEYLGWTREQYKEWLEEGVRIAKPMPLLAKINLYTIMLLMTGFLLWVLIGILQFLCIV